MAQAHFPRSQGRALPYSQTPERVLSSLLIMLSLYSVALLAAIVGVSTAAPPYDQCQASAPEPMTEGTITCVELDGSRVWNIALDFNEYGEYHHTDGDEVLHVKIDLAKAATGPINIENVPWDFDETGHIIQGHPYFGAVIHGVPGAIDMGPSKTSQAVLVATDQTEPGAGPSVIGSSLGDLTHRASFGASAIWLYDEETRHLKPQWINRNGKKAELRVFYDGFIDQFVLTGKAGRVDLYEPDFHECHLTFNPL